jgi:hypothetical protein
VKRRTARSEGAGEPSVAQADANRLAELLLRRLDVAVILVDVE